MKSYRFIFLILFVGLSIMLYAQPAERMVQVIVLPNVPIGCIKREKRLILKLWY